MSIHGAVSDKLAADVAAISGRAYRVQLPQNPTYPAIVYEQISNVRQHGLGGLEGFAEMRLEVTCYDTTHTAAKAVADSVRGSLDGWTGTVDSTTVRHGIIDNEQDFHDAELGVYGVRQDYFIAYAES